MPHGKSPAGRVHVFDALRGFALVNMIVYHGIYDWVYLFGRPAVWYTASGNAHIWQQCICWTFILLAGAVFSYGHHALRRGLITFGCGMLLTVVTLTVVPSEQIWFGVLHLIGSAVIITALLQRLLIRLPALPGACISFAAFLFVRGVPMGYVGIGEIPVWHLPQWLYTTRFAFILGLPDSGFYSADYFPLIPWLFLFWTGYFLWRFLQPDWEERLRAIPMRGPLAWLGRHSLWVYLIHQPVLMGVVFVLDRIWKI